MKLDENAWCCIWLKAQPATLTSRDGLISIAWLPWNRPKGKRHLTSSYYSIQGGVQIAYSNPANSMVNRSISNVGWSFSPTHFSACVLNIMYSLYSDNCSKTCHTVNVLTTCLTSPHITWSLESNLLGQINSADGGWSPRTAGYQVPSPVTAGNVPGFQAAVAGIYGSKWMFICLPNMVNQCYSI